MMGAMRDALRFGAGNNPQSPIQLTNSQGQSVAFQLAFDRSSGRLKLNLPRMPNLGELKEIRVSNVVRAETKVPFEFQDLPMP